MPRAPHALLPILLLLRLSTLAQGAAAQTTQYVEILDAYRRGDPDAAVTALADMPADVRYRSAQQVVGPRLTPLRRNLTQAVLALHAELVFRQGESWTCDTGTRSFRENHPDGTRQLLAEGHRSFESALLDALRDNRPQDDDFLRTYYLTVMAYSRRYYPGAVDCYRHAPPAIQKDAEMQLAFGAMHEGEWWTSQSEGWSLPVLRPSLETAERAYRAAIEAAPALDEARLRLGRVLELAGKPAAALEVLHEVHPRLEGDFDYLALLFEGEAHEQLGDLSAAAKSYSGAQSLRPHAESGIVAASWIAFLAGHRRVASDRIAGIGAAIANGGSREPWVWRTQGFDPWAWYSHGTAWRFPAYRAQLRAIVSGRR